MTALDLNVGLSGFKDKAYVPSADTEKITKRDYILSQVLVQNKSSIHFLVFGAFQKNRYAGKEVSPV